jgi:hypothetical protein
MGSRRPAAAAVALGLAAAVCGVAAGATPKTGSLFGQVLSTKGSTFVLQAQQAPKGKAIVTVAASTQITIQATGTTSDLRRGVCVTANGAKAKNGAVAAVRLSLSAPVKGSCVAGRRPSGAGAGNGRRPPAGGNRPPAGSRRPGTNRPANFGFAVGAITAVSGSTVTLHGPNGTAEVTVSKSTQISRAKRVKASGITAKACAFVAGTSTDGGATVKAQSVTLTTPRSGSGCSPGFGRQRR